MECTVKQLSPLEKIQSASRCDFPEIHSRRVLQGQRLSYQICVTAKQAQYARVSVDSPFGDHVKLYRVAEVPVDLPSRKELPLEEDYLARQSCMMPDMLVPLEAQNRYLRVNEKNSLIWVRVDIPADMPPGTYPLFVEFAFDGSTERAVMDVEVIPAVIPEQRLIYTRWLYADCVAVAHHVEIYSEAHWDLIDKYIEAAADVGINMILVPVHTPPLDTKIGTARPCVQLVDIEKQGDTYRFSFEKFHRFIGLCKKHGIRCFEIAHMFSQWGAACAPNIRVTENGKTGYAFGWHVKADSPEYVAFLKQYIPAIRAALEQEGISGQSYFHISDEPHVDNMAGYEAARNLISPLIGNAKVFDALSHVEFYEAGLVERPVTCIDAIHAFLKHPIQEQWVYYCCIPETVYPNCFLAMPSGRIRILGFLMYKYDIKGFLQWGFNFYNSALSLYPIDPHLTTSGDRNFPSGDPFIVYPGPGCVYGSIRGQVTHQAVEDMKICFALEKLIGRDKVTEMIDRAAGRDLRFDDYPTETGFFEDLSAQMIDAIRAAQENERR